MLPHEIQLQTAFLQLIFNALLSCRQKAPEGTGRFSYEGLVQILSLAKPGRSERSKV